MGEFHYIGLAALTKRGIKACTKAVNKSANDLVAKAAEAAPLESGALQGGIHTDGAQVKGNFIEARVETGGETSAYAAVQHEHEEFNHPIKGQAKYIEEPLLQNRDKYRDNMQKAAQEAF